MMSPLHGRLAVLAEDLIVSLSSFAEHRLISRNLRRPIAWAPSTLVMLPAREPRWWQCDPGCDGFDDELAAEHLAAAQGWLRGRLGEPPADAAISSVASGCQPTATRAPGFRLICRCCRGVYFSREG
jgi:hypothetical protein